MLTTAFHRDYFCSHISSISWSSVLRSPSSLSLFSLERCWEFSLASWDGDFDLCFSFVGDKSINARSRSTIYKRSFYTNQKEGWSVKVLVCITRSGAWHKKTTRSANTVVDAKSSSCIRRQVNSRSCYTVLIGFLVAYNNAPAATEPATEPAPNTARCNPCLRCRLHSVVILLHCWPLILLFCLSETVPLSTSFLHR